MARLRIYEAEGIRVAYDPGRCIHAAECVRGLPTVFDPQARPWVQPEHAATEAVADVVERCPTGALTYERTDGGPAEEPPAQATVQILADGPIAFHGTVRLTGPDSETDASYVRVALCRCGASANKPFCDGSHATAGFHPDSDADPTPTEDTPA